MKKIVLPIFIVSLFLFSNCFAKHLKTIDEAPKETMTITVPSDDEIMKVIKTYSNDPIQQEYLLKETKKSLEKLKEKQSK